MLPPPEWLKPPRSLLVILFLVTLVSVSALAWFGWKVLYQEQVVEAQRAQERLEQAADRIAATARGALAETGERVGAWLISPPTDGKPEAGLLLLMGDNSLLALPAGRLLYRPFPATGPEDHTGSFPDAGCSPSNVKAASAGAGAIKRPPSNTAHCGRSRSSRVTASVGASVSANE